MATLVLTVIGDDRPGLVDEFSGIIAGHGGNWESSRLVHLAEKFAGVVLVSVPDTRSAALLAALEAFDADGPLHVAVTASAGTAAPAAQHRLAVELTGQDHPGIVHEVSHALAARGIGIEELTTETRSASMAGGTLFVAHAAITAPASVSAEQLRDDLRALADDLAVDIDVLEDDPKP